MSRRYSPKSRKTKGFRSKFESDFADYLNKAKVKFGYEQDVLLYEVPRKYHPDFTLNRPTRKARVERKLFIELKGRFTSADRNKMLAVKEQNPFLDIRLIFMQDNFLYKGSKTRYSDWCVKHGFEYHVVKNTKVFIPDEWLIEVQQQ